MALKDTLSDLFGGINILLSKTMQEGDYVQLDNGYQGYVENVGWRYTTIRERANNIISIPNSVLSGSISKNFSSMDSAFRVPIQIGVSYDSDLDHVEKVALDVALEIYDELECVSKSYKPVIRFREFADSSVNFFIYFQGKNFGDHNTILNSYIKKLHKRFKEEKIDMEKVEKHLNFEIPQTQFTNFISDFEIYLQCWKEGKLFTSYPTNGLVLKINSRKLQKYLGENNLSIPWAYSIN